MEELSHERLSAFVSGLFGDLPLSGLPPDILAFGAALVTSVLLACGLKQAGILRASMNLLCLFGFIFFLCVGGTHTRTNNSNIEERTSNSQQVLAGAGVCCCLFFQFLELGKRSKAEPHPHSCLLLSISLTKGGVLLASLALGLVLSSMMDNRFPVSGAPLLRALQLRDVDWARLLIGSFQIIILGLGISEAGECVSKHLVSMASDGFIPAFLSFECPFSFSYSRAHLLSGVWAALLALFLTHFFLLEFMATNILLLNILIILATLYRPYRSPQDSLCSIPCSVAVTTSSKGQCVLSSTRLLDKRNTAKTAASDKTVLFLKSGLRIFSCNNPTFKSQKEEELSTPLLSSLYSADVDADEEDCNVSNTSKSTEISVDSCTIMAKNNSSYYQQNWSINTMNLKSCTVSKTEDMLTQVEHSLSPSNNGNPPVSNCIADIGENIDSDKEPLQSGQVTPDEDIDLIVSEYKKQLRISTLGPRTQSVPTVSTARKALLVIVCLIIASIFLSILSLQITQRDDEIKAFNLDPRSSLIFVTIILIVGLLVYLGRLPSMKSSSGGFKMPASPWLSFVTLYLNILLVTGLISRTFWFVLPLHLSGIVWYAFYSSKHSIAATHFYKIFEGRLRPKLNERICISPSFLPASVYTSQPQTQAMTNRHI